MDVFEANGRRATGPTHMNSRRRRLRNNSRTSRRSSIAHEFPRTPGGDQPGGFQLFHVMGQSWRRNIEAFPHGLTGHRFRATADPFDDLVPTRISQCFCDVLHLLFCQFSQFGRRHFSCGNQQSNRRNVSGGSCLLRSSQIIGLPLPPVQAE